MAGAEEISADAAVARDLSEVDSISSWKDDQRVALKASLNETKCLDMFVEMRSKSALIVIRKSLSGPITSLPFPNFVHRLFSQYETYQAFNLSCLVNAHIDFSDSSTTFSSSPLPT